MMFDSNLMSVYLLTEGESQDLFPVFLFKAQYLTSQGKRKGPAEAVKLLSADPK